MKSFDEALAHLLAVVQPVSEIRHVPLEAAAGRVLAADQSSTVAVPPLDNSAMDGYALRAEDVPVPGTQLPVSQRIPAGTVGSELQPGTAARIFTGAPIPPGAECWQFIQKHKPELWRDHAEAIRSDDLSRAASTFKAMLAGDLYGSIAQGNFDMGRLGVEKALEVIAGKTIDKRIDSGATLITKENAQELLDFRASIK